MACNICGKKFKKKELLISHLTNHLYEISEIENDFLIYRNFRGSK